MSYDDFFKTIDCDVLPCRAHFDFRPRNPRLHWFQRAWDARCAAVEQGWTSELRSGNALAGIPAVGVDYCPGHAELLRHKADKTNLSVG